MNKSSKILDVVNLNADASCLSSKWWMQILDGKKNSYLYNWFNNYVILNKKVTLGITGATLADIHTHNPECLALINNNRDKFEICLRPFSHDIALLRSNESFHLNLEVGKATLKKIFGSYQNYFLPPEFMLTNTQVKMLADSNVEGTFINATRFNEEIQQRIPSTPYKVKGILNSSLNTIPFDGKLTKNFLNGIHHFNAHDWNNRISNNELNYCWRDGESAFFLPNGIEREHAWLSQESGNIERVHLADVIQNIDFSGSVANQFYSYPVHSFSAWVKEFKMIGFINKVREIELKLPEFTSRQKAIWLQLINSDILSSVEKPSPQIDITTSLEDKTILKYTIWRAERGLEGEEILHSISNSDINLSQHLDKKINGRIDFLNKIKF